MPDEVSGIFSFQCDEIRKNQNFILQAGVVMGESRRRLFFNPRARARANGGPDRVNEIHKKSQKTNGMAGSQRPLVARITRAVPYFARVRDSDFARARHAR